VTNNAPTAFPLGNTTVTWTVTDGSGNTATATQLVTVNLVTTTTTVTVSPSTQQYSDMVTLTANVTNCNSTSNGGTVDFTIKSNATNIEQFMGTAPVVDGVATLQVALLESIALSTATPPAGVMAPGTKTVRAVFTPASGTSVLGSSGMAALTVTKEDAVPYYTGSLFATTASTTATTATVNLAATINDITAMYPGTDNKPGDIRNARVKFVNRDNNTDLTGWLTPGLINADTKVGLVQAQWTGNIGNSDAVSFTIGIVVDNGYYIRNSSEDNEVITITKPLPDLVTGGGYIMNTNVSGNINPVNGKRSNFGFNIKRTKNGVLQGNVNFIIRSNDGKVYQAKGNAMTTLSVSPATASSPAQAVFTGKCNLQDITNPLVPLSIAGNLNMQLSVTDRGEPGVFDDILMIVYDRDNSTVLFTSNFDAGRMQQQRIAGGNIKVHSNGSFATGTASSTTALVSSNNPSTQGQSVTFTATVTGSGTMKATGSVQFVDITKGTTLATGVINSTTGVATYTTSTLTVGLHEIAVYYGGDSRYLPSSRSVNQNVNEPLVTARSATPAASSRTENIAPQTKKVELFEVVLANNPTNHQFTVQVIKGTGEPFEITVTDFNGRMVEQLKLPKDQTLNFGDKYFGGVYFLQVKQGKNRQVLKLMKLN
jgi:hypothetical protein